MRCVVVVPGWHYIFILDPALLYSFLLPQSALTTFPKRSFEVHVHNYMFGTLLERLNASVSDKGSSRQRASNGIQCIYHLLPEQIGPTSCSLNLMSCRYTYNRLCDCSWHHIHVRYREVYAVLRTPPALLVVPGTLSTERKISFRSFLWTELALKLTISASP